MSLKYIYSKRIDFAGCILVIKYDGPTNINTDAKNVPILRSKKNQRLNSTGTYLHNKYEDQALSNQTVTV